MENTLPRAAPGRHHFALRGARWVAGVLAFCAVAFYLLTALPAPADPVRIVAAVEIDRPAGAVFDFVTTPANWPKWHPSSLRVSGAIDHSLEKGERTTEEYVVAGRRGRAQWTVVERDAPRIWRIEGMGEEGGRAWITYTLSETASRTHFEREMRYRMPNLLAAWLDPLVSRSKIRAESETALRQLKQVLEDQPHARMQ